MFLPHPLSLAPVGRLPTTGVLAKGFGHSLLARPVVSYCIETLKNARYLCSCQQKKKPAENGVLVRNTISLLPNDLVLHFSCAIQAEEPLAMMFLFLCFTRSSRRERRGRACKQAEPVLACFSCDTHRANARLTAQNTMRRKAKFHEDMFAP